MYYMHVCLCVYVYIESPYYLVNNMHLKLAVMIIIAVEFLY